MTKIHSTVRMLLLEKDLLARVDIFADFRVRCRFNFLCSHGSGLIRSQVGEGTASVPEQQLVIKPN